MMSCVMCNISPPEQQQQPQEPRLRPHHARGQLTDAALHGKGPRLYVGGIADDITEDEVLSPRHLIECSTETPNTETKSAVVSLQIHY
jgi:hypothetical protein